MIKKIDNLESATEEVAVKAENVKSDTVTKANSGNTKKSNEKHIVSTEKIMEVGGHIGYSKKRWNPKMKPFIYTRRGYHFNPQYDVFNLPLLHEKLKTAFQFLTEIASNKGVILFVGTKNKQVQDLIKEIAKRIDVNYIYQRWLGGTLTNFKTIDNSIKQLHKLTKECEIGLGKYTKKEQILILKKKAKLEKFVGGIKNMRGLPNVIVIDDPVHEKNAVLEARKLNIPIVAISNTNADPDLIDYIVPANNTSIRSITLFMNILADAIAIGRGKEPLFAFKNDSEIVIAQPLRREYRNIVNRSHNYQKIQNLRRENQEQKDKK